MSNAVAAGEGGEGKLRVPLFDVELLVLVFWHDCESTLEFEFLIQLFREFAF